MNGNFGGDGGKLDLLLLLVRMNTNITMMRQKKERKKDGFDSIGKCLEIDCTRAILATFEGENEDVFVTE